MARRLQFDTSIMTDMRAASSDSFKDNIQMIEVSKLKPSLDNFYVLSEIELLADDIERQGLKHNLVVTEDADALGTYFIKSGHRRFTAIKFLIEQNRYTSKYVPCLVDGTKTQSENVLDLIMLNATTRVMSDAELYKQYEVLRDTLEQLKLEGKKVKGRLREQVAKILNVSPAQVGKIENIRHNAVEEVQEAVEQGDLSIATADKIAKLSEGEQQEIVETQNLAEIRTADVKPKSKTTSPVQDTLPEETEPEDTSDEPPVTVTENWFEEESNSSFPVAEDEDPELFEEPESDIEDVKEEDTADEESESTELTDEERMETYRRMLMETMQNFESKVTDAESMRELDKAVVYMQNQLKKIMEEI